MVETEMKDPSPAYDATANTNDLCTCTSGVAVEMRSHVLFAAQHLSCL
jgi:hypothetical protein